MSRCDERLKARVEESTCLTCTGLYGKTNQNYLTTKKRSTRETSTSVMDKRTIQTRWQPHRHPSRHEKPKPSEAKRVYYESIKREPKIKSIYEYRCDERLQTKSKEFTRLPYTGLVLELEHLKIEPRLIKGSFANAMGECENQRRQAPHLSSGSHPKLKPWQGCCHTSI